MSGSKELILEGAGAYYIRVSSDRQDTERQRQSIDGWLTRHELSIPAQFRFEDEGFERDLPNTRPEFQRLMAAVDAGLLRWVVADRQDRFGSKDKYQFIAFMHRLREGNCRFFTVDDKCWNDDSMMSFFEGGMGAETSEKEQKEKGYRVLQSQLVKARRGEWQGGHVAYGMDIGCYGVDAKEKWRVVIEGRDLVGSRPGKNGKRRRVYSTRRLKVWPDGQTERFDGQGNSPATELSDTLRITPTNDKTKLAVVREVFTKFATESISPTQLAGFLNRLGVEHHYSERWEHYHVREMLKNPIYIGFQRWNSNGQGRFFEFLDGETQPVLERGGRRERNKDDWILSDSQLFDPVVPMDIWRAVQQKFDDNPRESRSPKSSNLWLAGLLYCSHCGQAMRGMDRGTRCEYFCSTYAKKKTDCDCLRNSVNHDVLEQEIRTYLEESGKEASVILEAQQTGNLELLKPYQLKHQRNLARFCTALGRMVDGVIEHEDWEHILNTVGGAEPYEAGPPTSLEDFHDKLATFILPVQKAYQFYFQQDEEVVRHQLEQLDAEHTKLTDRVLNLDPNTGKRAIEKANHRIAELEGKIEELEGSLKNWAEEFQRVRDETFAHVLALSAAEDVLEDPESSNRRKAQAVRSCIQRINLTFRPTGKKYPTSELVDIEIIPADPQYPNGASG